MSAWGRLGKELREVGIVTAYFFACFLVFLTLKKLLLEQYDVRITVVQTALVGALVVAKVVILLDKTTLGRRFRSSPLIAHILWRTVTYTFIVFLVTLAEHLFEYHRAHGGIPPLSSLLSAKEHQRFLAMNLCVALSFLVYNAFAELGRHVGDGSLRRFFLARRQDPV